MNALQEYVEQEMTRRFWHAVFTEKPYEECECSEGGRCQPKDPAKRSEIRGLSCL